MMKEKCKKARQLSIGVERAKEFVINAILEG